MKSLRIFHLPLTTTTTVATVHKPPIFSLSSSIFFSRHKFSLFNLSAIKMPPSSSKTLIDFFPQTNSKRRKTTDNGAATSFPPPRSSSLSNSDNNGDYVENPSDGDSNFLTAEQKFRMEFNKSLALSKMNLRICSEKVQNSRGFSLFTSHCSKLLGHILFWWLKVKILHPFYIFCNDLT